ncbi:unnamed protein product [Arctia plantaginis]|uniref:Uncharacterized protein n=1 Tax=Arctia plantaginis TaxID=874455 RepID=A0A8S0Z939_ARCPL|nr:unnamed protein product [Arctia plantaginis]CAB3249188.1 unnamed protein product [Arctia plantaginis]
MPSSSILNIEESVLFDDSIKGIEYHSYTPYHKSYKNNDDIRIRINDMDTIVLPFESVLIVEGTTVQVNKAPTMSSSKLQMQEWITNKGLAYLPTMLKVELYQIIKEHKEAAIYEADQLLIAITSAMKLVIS